MDIREFFQAVAGAVVLQPDQILMGSAKQSSAILQALGRSFGSSTGFLDAFGLVHTFCLVAGLGLLLGLGATTSVFIGVFVVLGVAGGLFALGSLFGVLGFSGDALTNGITNAFNATLARPYAADAFVVFPFVVLALGVVRYRWGAGRRSRKSAEMAQGSMRQYCSYCGSVLRPGKKKCDACGQGVPKPSNSHCSSCGRYVPKDARYCWFCGEEVLWSGDAKCSICGEAVAAGARFCPRCGARRQGAKADQAQPPP